MWLHAGPGRSMQANVNIQVISVVFCTGSRRCVLYWQSKVSNSSSDCLCRNVLPFGSSASVYAFNRIARACHAIGVRLLGLVWGNYYDDYPQLDLVVSQGNAQATAKSFFELIGWRVSMNEAKRAPMSKQFDALRVTFDLSKTQTGAVLARNKLSRVDQTCSEMDEIEFSGVLSIAKASSIRGKLQFAETHTFGRVLASHLKFFNLRAAGELSGHGVSPGMREEIS